MTQTIAQRLADPFHWHVSGGGPCGLHALNRSGCHSIRQRIAWSGEPSPPGVVVGWTSYQDADALAVSAFLAGIPANEQYWLTPDGRGRQPASGVPAEVAAAAGRLVEREITCGVKPVFSSEGYVHGVSGPFTGCDTDDMFGGLGQS